MATSVNGCRKLSSHASVWTPTVEMNNNCDEQEQLAIFDHSCDHRSNWTPLTYVALVNGVQKLLLRFCSLISQWCPEASNCCDEEEQQVTLIPWLIAKGILTLPIRRVSGRFSGLREKAFKTEAPNRSFRQPLTEVAVANSVRLLPVRRNRSYLDVGFVTGMSLG